MSELRKWWDDRYGLTQSYNPWPYQLIGLIWGWLKHIADPGYSPKHPLALAVYIIGVTTMCAVMAVPICLTNSQPKTGDW